MSQANPTRDDFAAMLQESFAVNDLAEGYVAKGIITAIEKDVAIVQGPAPGTITTSLARAFAHRTAFA